MADQDLNKADVNLKGKTFSGIKASGTQGVKDMISERLDSVQDSMQNMEFDWRTVLSGLAVIGAVGALAFLRKGRSSKGLSLGNIGKRIGGIKGGHKASHSHRNVSHRRHVGRPKKNGASARA